MYISKYEAKFNTIYLESDGEYLTGLWFKDSKDSKKHNLKDRIEKDLPIFDETKKWLDIYFNGQKPNFTPKYKVNQTEFGQEVIEIMEKIPYGEVTTYGDIAKEIAQKRNIKRMSSQAVGNAVGANPICIIIPCHRVVGKDRNLTGYGGGLNNKVKLLETEGLDMSRFYMPKRRKNEKM